MDKENHQKRDEKPPPVLIIYLFCQSRIHKIMHSTVAAKGRVSWAWNELIIFIKSKEQQAFRLLLEPRALTNNVVRLKQYHDTWPCWMSAQCATAMTIWSNKGLSLIGLWIWWPTHQCCMHASFLMSYSVETTKLLTALVIFLCGLLSTISPLFVAGRNKWGTL
jgi:hypothetical protein